MMGGLIGKIKTQQPQENQIKKNDNIIVDKYIQNGVVDLL